MKRLIRALFWVNGYFFIIFAKHSGGDTRLLLFFSIAAAHGACPCFGPELKKINKALSRNKFGYR